MTTRIKVPHVVYEFLRESIHERNKKFSQHWQKIPEGDVIKFYGATEDYEVVPDEITCPTCHGRGRVNPK